MLDMNSLQVHRNLARTRNLIQFSIEVEQSQHAFLNLK